MNALLLVFVAYLVGGFSTGYWLVRLKTGADIRTQGSGGTGATNTGRVLGARGFAVVLLGDALKAALMVGAARYLNLGELWEHACGLAVIAGHIWPVQLRFKGGKGVAPLLGAWLILSPYALIPCLVITLLSHAITKRFTLSGLIGLLALPVAAYWADKTWVSPVAAVITYMIVLYSHRENLKALRTQNKG